MRLSVTRTAKICPIEIAANISACVTGKPAQLHSRPCSPKLQPALPAAFFALAHLALADPFGELWDGWSRKKRRGGLGLSHGEIPWIFQAQVYRQDFPSPTRRGCCSLSPRRNNQTSSG